jgi:Glycosyltransferases, probably involved in cell wall biogenesis
MSADTQAGVTIITSTIRQELMSNVFDNYSRQEWPNKELIIVINNNRISMRPYKELAQQYENVRVFRVNGRYHLGACLNFAVARAQYDYIAKFDDDDYYSPQYLDESMLLFTKKKADVVGKNTTYFFFPHRSLLLLRRRTAKPYCRCQRIAGPTIMFRKKVFKKVAFSTKVVAGSDARFVRACLKRGFRVFTASSYNFAQNRRSNRKSHTWKVSERRLLASKGAKIIRTKDFKSHVDRTLDLLPLPDGMHSNDGNEINEGEA